VDDEIRFYLDLGDRVTGPVSDDDAREAMRAGKLGPDARVRLAGSEVWGSPGAFAALANSPDARPPVMPSASDVVVRDVPPELAAMPLPLRDLLLFWVHAGARVTGPRSGADLRRAVESGLHAGASASLVDSGVWYPAAAVALAPRVAPRDPSVVPAVQPTRDSSASSAGEKRGPQRAIYLGAAASPPSSRSSASLRGPTSVIQPTGATGAPGATVRCPICLEQVAANLSTCSECGEAVAASPSSMRGPPSIPDLAPNASWLASHWRPLVTLGVMATIVCSGITLRHLAPGRFALPQRAGGKATATASAPAACSAPCWSGEACHEGRCEWRPPNDVGHVAAKAEPTVGGPFTLPRDVSDALPLDSERFAVSLLTGLQLHNARTGGVLGTVTDAPQARRLYRVGTVVYATAPQRIYVVDAATTRLLKTIETGAAVGEVTLGASGRRALASLPSAHAVAVLATEYHAEIDRIQFGDDVVGPMGADDTGKRALTTTGQIPLAGLRDAVSAGSAGSAVYAFDPSRLASEQDRVRASVVGNPVSVLMTPDGETSLVVLRAEDALVPLAWQPSGAVRQEAPIPTCREPEQIELVRRGRLGIVRCNEGHAIEVFDLRKRELVRHIPFNARVADLAVSPDGKQAIVALPADGAGFVGIVDLETYAVKVLPLTAEPTRVRLSPDGSTALVLSDRAKVAWVIR
jgi:hypothetical protein